MPEFRGFYYIHKDQYCLGLSKIKGISLKELAQSENDDIIISAEDLRIMGEFLETGLQKLHDGGIHHGDLDSCNILLDLESRKAYFVDFASSTLRIDSSHRNDSDLEWEEYCQSEKDRVHNWLVKRGEYRTAQIQRDIEERELDLQWQMYYKMYYEAESRQKDYRMPLHINIWSQQKFEENEGKPETVLIPTNNIFDENNLENESHWKMLAVTILELVEELGNGNSGKVFLIERDSSIVLKLVSILHCIPILITNTSHQ